MIERANIRLHVQRIRLGRYDHAVLGEAGFKTSAFRPAQPMKIAQADERQNTELHLALSVRLDAVSDRRHVR